MSDLSGILEAEWRKDSAHLDARTAATVLNNLMNRYSEPQRRYHSRSHLCSLFYLMALHAPHIPPGTSPRLAIWWHDAIYDPKARDNEELSAELAREHLAQLGTPAALIQTTANLILMTKNHWSGPSSGDGDYFLDADIAILGAPPRVYERYAADVRQEYAWAADPAWRAGRSAFLQSAGARPRLFRTDAFETAYGQQARFNMRSELASLAG
jgi:predicted metal-dependent HD superfamily phosphohydrolase